MTWREYRKWQKSTPTFSTWAFRTRQEPVPVFDEWNPKLEMDVKVKHGEEWLTWDELCDRHHKAKSGCDDPFCELSHRSEPHDYRFICMDSEQKNDQQWEQVDCGIAPLVEALWQRGMMTTLSCENNVPKGFVWIQFDGINSAAKFMDRIFHHCFDDKKFGIRALGKSKTKEDRHLNWIHEYHVKSNSKRLHDSSWEDKRHGLGWWSSKFNLYTRFLRSSRGQQQERVLRVDVRFPHADFYKVLSAFE